MSDDKNEDAARIADKEPPRSVADLAAVYEIWRAEHMRLALACYEGPRDADDTRDPAATYQEGNAHGILYAADLAHRLGLAQAEERKLPVLDLDLLASAEGTVEAMLLGGCVAGGEALIDLRGKLAGLREVSTDPVRLAAMRAPVDGGPQPEEERAAMEELGDGSVKWVDGATVSAMVATRALIGRLRDVGTGATPHVYRGACPDNLSVLLGERDDKCPACAVLRLADVALDGNELSPSAASKPEADRFVDDVPLLVVGAIYVCRACGVRGCATGINTWPHPAPWDCEHAGISLGRGWVQSVTTVAELAAGAARAAALGIAVAGPITSSEVDTLYIDAMLLGKAMIAEVQREEEAATGPYTRAQFAAAIDEVHAIFHDMLDQKHRRYHGEACAMCHGSGSDRTCPRAESDPARCDDGDMLNELLGGRDIDCEGASHEALHRVGAGVPRVDCASDPEAQRLLRDLLAVGERELPCGHKVEDLIGGKELDGRPCVTKCGACLAEWQPEIVAKNRANEAKKVARKTERDAWKALAQARYELAAWTGIDRNEVGMRIDEAKAVLRMLGIDPEAP